MASFTPGPWVSHGARITGANGEPVCDVVHSVPHNGARFDANRDLICAAPEMLDALKDAELHLGVLALPTLRNLIDKAEGR